MNGTNWIQTHIVKHIGHMGRFHHSCHTAIGSIVLSISKIARTAHLNWTFHVFTTYFGFHLPRNDYQIIIDIINEGDEL